MKGKPYLMNGKQYGWMLALVVIASFVGGVVSNRIFADQQVLAQLLNTTTISVPNGGVQFKTPEGRLVASLTTDSQGGHFYVYNNAQQPVARLDAWIQTGQLNIGTFDHRLAAIQVADPRTP